MTQFTLSTHVLDLDSGQPAEGLLVALATAEGDLIGQVATDADGRIKEWPDVSQLEGGTYSLVFEVSVWYAEREQACFYPEVRVEFIADEARHYHVPLLLNRFGYSTYRGS